MNLRTEALLTLERKGQVLDVAREVSQLLRDRGLVGVIIGGIAVLLHGHVRTTQDVAVLVADAPAARDALMQAGFAWDEANRQFLRGVIPGYLVTAAQVPHAPSVEEVDGILLASLADLLSMKLRSGTRDILRAQDLADVIGLVRARKLDGTFVSQIDRDLRPEFRRLLQAIQNERQEN